MLIKLVINAKYRAAIKSISSKLDAKQQDYWVSFIINSHEKTLTLIGGHTPEYVCQIILLEEIEGVGKYQFAIDGDLYNRFLKYSGKSNDIELILKIIEKKIISFAVKKIKKNKKQAYYRRKPASFLPAHGEYIEKTRQLPHKIIRAVGTSILFHEGNVHAPYEALFPLRVGR